MIDLEKINFNTLMRNLQSWYDPKDSLPLLQITQSIETALARQGMRIDSPFLISDYKKVLKLLVDSSVIKMTMDEFHLPHHHILGANK